MLQQSAPQPASTLSGDLTGQTVPDLDLRLVLAMAGKRELTAREQAIVDKITTERGESLFADMLYTLTRKSFPTRQAKQWWHDILAHQETLKGQLGRDPGLILAAHDYLTNIVGQLKGVGLIEETKFLHLTAVATRDGLTGLFDKSTFHRILTEELARQSRHARLVSLVMIDIDHFKKLNDTFGHADGDVALTQVAEVITEQIRTTDSVGRFGGEEFSVVLPETDAQAAGILAERIRIAIEKRFAGTPWKLTVSLGVACIQPEAQDAHTDLSDTLIRTADKALYEAKNAGRNQVMVAASN